MSGMVIIGAGECGTRAAFALREQGWQGAITLIGAEDGLPYERPPLSKPVAGDAHRKPICDGPGLAAAGIDYLAGVSVSGIDPSARAGSTIACPCWMAGWNWPTAPASRC